MVAFAAVGLVANGVSMVVLARAEHGSLNMRGAVNEVFADLLGSLLAVVAGVVIWTTGWQQADSIATLLIAVLILPRAFALLATPPWCCSRSRRTGSTSTTCGPPAERPGRDRRPRPARLDDHQRHPLACPRT